MIISKIDIFPNSLEKINYNKDMKRYSRDIFKLKKEKVIYMVCKYKEILDCECNSPTKEYFHSGCHTFEMNPFAFQCPKCKKGIISATSNLTMACDKCTFEEEIINFSQNEKYPEIQNLAKMISNNKNEETKGKFFNVTYQYSMIGTISIELPHEMTREEAIQYAKDNLEELPLPTDSDYLTDSSELDEENCDFE